MNIVICYEHGIGEDTFGGGQRILIETINELKKNSNNITLVMPKKTKDENLNLLISGVVIVYSINSIIAFLSGFYIFIHLLFNNLLKADVIIAFTSEIFWLSLFKKFYNYKLSSYLAAPDLSIFNESSILRKFKIIRYNIELYLFILGFKRADIKLAIGQRIKDQAEKYFNIKMIKIVYPGINLKFIKKLKYLNDSKNINDNNNYNKINILYIGRIDFQHKPLNELIDGLYNCKDSWDYLHIVGNGPDLEKINNIENNQLRNKIILYGSKNISDITYLFSEIDLAILPSNYESFMLTVYEMIAIGVVTVYNDVADLKNNLQQVNTAFCMENKSYNYTNFVEKFNSLKFSFEDLKLSSEYILNNFNWYKLSKELINV